jgi:hypothetical protein
VKNKYVSKEGGFPNGYYLEYIYDYRSLYADFYWTTDIPDNLNGVSRHF